MEKEFVKSVSPLVLMIFDGFGHRDQVHFNAILNAHAPHWNQLQALCPRTLLHASGEAVGLPDGQMGNSEVGHLTMGAGRILYQDLTRIHCAIDSGEFDQNTVLREALLTATQTGKSVHFIGLFSDGGVHSHERHWYALLKLAKQLDVPSCWLHLFLDGRDVPPQSALTYLQRLETVLQDCPNAEIASISGRYYAMDRDHRFDRTRLAYETMMHGCTEQSCEHAQAAIQSGYERGETDEFIVPTCVSSSYSGMQDGDVMVYVNFRADRARQLCDAFMNPAFSGFTREHAVQFSRFITMSEYDVRFADWGVHVAFPPLSLENNFSEYISQHGLKQLHLAETEKYAHVTFFFNGGKENPYEGEDRILIPSPHVSTYDLQPEMSAEHVTDALIQAIQSKQYDFIIVNYANADMVGHTGDFSAAIKAVEALDQCLGRAVDAIRKCSGELVITADHGNAELMYDDVSGQPHTAHTTERVPFVYMGDAMVQIESSEEGWGLQDIAPTLLYLLNLPQPPEMTGHSIIRKFKSHGFG